MEPYETIEYRGYTIEVHPDMNPESPRSWDNLGKILAFHNRYDFNETKLTNDMFSDWVEVKAFLKKKVHAVVILPIYMYEHGGITVSTDRTGQYADCWDSGCLGCIFATREAILDNFQKKKLSANMIEHTERILEAEIKEWDEYLRGDVYGYKVINPDGDDTDSCWGYYGDEGKSEMIDNAKAIIDSDIEHNRKQHEAKLKAQIKSHAPLEKREAVEA